MDCGVRWDDSDYYKAVSLSGAVVHVETFARRIQSTNTLDTAIELVDANGIRFNTCRPVGDATAPFTSPCVNDDVSATPHVTDSALDFQVPGAPSTPTTFYTHVLDWRGDARPDMFYQLQVNGVVAPMIVRTTSL